MIVRALKFLPAVASLMALSATHAVAGPAGAGEPGWEQTGRASFYSNKYVGRRTASGVRYDPAALTAAHPWLPLGTRLRVLCEDTDRAVEVTVIDRQAHNGRVIDLSRHAAEALGILGRGTATVRLIALSNIAPFAEEAGVVERHPPMPRRSAVGVAAARHGHVRRAAVHVAATDARPRHAAPRRHGHTLS